MVIKNTYRESLEVRLERARENALELCLKFFAEEKGSIDREWKAEEFKVLRRQKRELTALPLVVPELQNDSKKASIPDRDIVTHHKLRSDTTFQKNFRQRFSYERALRIKHELLKSHSDQLSLLARRYRACLSGLNRAENAEARRIQQQAKIADTLIAQLHLSDDEKTSPPSLSKQATFSFKRANSAIAMLAAYDPRTDTNIPKLLRPSATTKKKKMSTSASSTTTQVSPTTTKKKMTTSKKRVPQRQKGIRRRRDERFSNVPYYPIPS